MVDCESVGEYNMELAAFVQMWDDIEKEDTGKEPSFSRWFLKYKSEQCKNNMLKPQHQRAGLGENARQYTTNDNETMNSVISRLCPQY